MPKSTKLRTNRVRAALALRGTSLRKWAIARGHNDKTVYAALHGHRGGKKSRQILEDLERLVHA
jgi:gp16 family phage-associated protein